MNTGTQLDAKRRAAGEKDESYDPPTKLVSLIDQSEVPTVTRSGKRSPMLETAEWKAACELLNKGLPAGKALQIPLSAETLKMQKTAKHSAIGFKRHSSVAMLAVIGEMWTPTTDRRTKPLWRTAPRIWSVYHLQNGTKIWIITEAESVDDDPNSRLSTCVATRGLLKSLR